MPHWAGRIWKQRLGHPKYNPALISLGVSRAMGDLMFKHADYTGPLQLPTRRHSLAHYIVMVTDPTTLYSPFL